MEEKSLIEGGADIHCVDSEGRNALMLAANSGDENRLRRLIDAGADIHCLDREGRNALMHAAGYVNCLKLLLEAGADVSVKASNGETVLHYVCKKLWVFINSEAACECMTILIDSGADVMTTDSKEQTVLMHAARDKSRDDRLVNLLSILVKAGAVVNQQDSSGVTALAHAASAQNSECVRWLLDSGASINICDDFGRTPLHHCFMSYPFKVEACLRLLLSKKPNVDAKDNDGMTPLMYVVRQSLQGTQTVAIVTMLLKHGAEINLVDNLGQTALIYSLRLQPDCRTWFNNQCTDCFHLLLKKGANFNVGQIASGRLDMLAYIDSDLDLIKLQVGSTVDFNVSKYQFGLLLNGKRRKIIQFLTINGVVPSLPGSFTSVLECAAVSHNPDLGVVKYLIAADFLRAEDLTFVCSGHVGDDSLRSVIENVRSQPWPLVKLCFVAVSTALGASPGRQQRVRNSQLPVKLQRMLLFQEPSSRLCVNQWDKISLTFNPEKYEELPRPRPLLYHWPVGRALIPCDCGKCDGTLYKYEGSDSEEDD